MIILGPIPYGTLPEQIDREVRGALEAFYGLTPAPTRQQVIDAVADAVAPYADRVTRITVLVSEDALSFDLEITL